MNKIAVGIVFSTLMFGQAPGVQDRTFRFAYAPTVQQINEISTVIRAITDIKTEVNTDAKTMVATGTPDQLSVVSWLFSELDRPGNQQPDAHTQAVLEQKMAGVGSENIVRIFYVPYAQTLQQFQEIATAVRSVTEIRRMFTYNAPRAIVTRGTADQTAAAAWLFDVLGQTPAANAPPATYRMPPPSSLREGLDDVLSLIYLPNTPTAQDFQELATLIRSTADIRRLFVYNATRALVLRGSSQQDALAAWLAQQLDASPTHSPAAYSYPEGDAHDVHIFYLPASLPVDDFQRRVQSVRSQTKIPRTFTYNRLRAAVMRGNINQIEQAAVLFGEN